MATNYADLINQAYAQLGRTGIGSAPGQIDPGGFDYWRSRLETGLTPEQFNREFNDTVANYYTEKPNEDQYKQYISQNLVNNAYAQLGRTGVGGAVNQIDPGGNTYWQNQLNTGAIRPDQFNSTFMNTAVQYLNERPNDPYSQYIMQFLGAQTPDQAASMLQNGITGQQPGTAVAPYGYSGGAAADMQNMTNAIQGQIGSNMAAPTTQAPAQNAMDLTGNYDRFLNQDPGQNPYLQGALQRGADQARWAYGNLLQDQAQQFNNQIMPAIRGGAIAAGGYGGSRQGIAEGIAARAQSQQANRAATQLGMDLNSAMIGGQSGAFQQGQQLGANLLGNLSGQQYQAAAGNLGSQLATNQLNQNVINQGIQNQGQLFNNMTNLAGSQDAWMLNRLASAGQTMSPYAQMTSTQQSTAPLYNNPYGNILGYGLAGAQLGRLI